MAPPLYILIPLEIPIPSVTVILPSNLMEGSTFNSPYILAPLCTINSLFTVNPLLIVAPPSIVAPPETSNPLLMFTPPLTSRVVLGVVVPIPTLAKSLLYMLLVFSPLTLQNPPPFCRNQLTQSSVAKVFPITSLYDMSVWPVTAL